MTATLAEALAPLRADLFAHLKPLEDFMAEQKAAAAKPPEKGSFGTLPWQISLGQSVAKWTEAPKAGQAILFQKDGSHQLLPPTALMGAGGFLEMVERPVNNIWPALPVGSIIIGGFTGVIAGEFLDAFFPPRNTDGTINFTSVGAKAGTVLALALFGDKVMSKTASVIAAAFLGIQILVDTLPIGEWLLSLVNWVLGLFGKEPLTALPGPLAQDKPMREIPPPSGFHGSYNDLYAGIYGRGR